MAGFNPLCTCLLAVAIVQVVLASDSKVTHHDYCLVGAGPGGMQLGYFLERAGRDYIIFEKEGIAGSFFAKYPRHRSLISINKRHTGKTNKEFNLRHDWNSLLSDNEDLLMRHYSRKFFPSADSLVQYFQDYASTLKLKIQYNTYIKNVSKDDGTSIFYLKDQNATMYSCNILVMSSGMWIENIPKFVGVEHTEGYPDVSVNPDDFEGQTVLVLGRGNAGFEIAESIIGATNFIHMASRNRLRLSWQTHYVGDVRAVNDGPIDTYQLKSLDAQFEGSVTGMEFTKKEDGKIYLDYSEKSLFPDNNAVRDPYDRVIRCMGFKFDFSIFDSDIKPKFNKRTRKYPEIKPNYESTKTPGMYFSGTNTHSLDWRLSAGGFIHGFRYTTRALFRLMEWKHQGVQWPSITLSFMDLQDHIVKRLNEASGIYQMFSNLADVVVFRGHNKFEYYDEVPIGVLNRFKDHTGHTFPRGIVINLEYGKNFSGPGRDPFHEGRAVGEAASAHQSNFLHPVFYFYRNGVAALNEDMTLPTPDRLHHIVEDFLTEWNAPVTHHLPLRWFLEYATGRDLRNFYADSCFKFALTSQSLPLFCQEMYMKGQAIPRSAADGIVVFPKDEPIVGMRT